ncbi:DciA family protein [Streptomyces sp. NPDC058295]|uniref:DciA family protein n=1 Tax=Streptomyces sp. NPDC058295 TaxID=3346431 RepID=UPI0036E76A3D
MPETTRGAGADLARQALAAARAAAKTAPTANPKKPRRTMRPHRGEGRDPQGLGTLLGKLQAEQGWEASLDGGSLIDQWAKICPTELADSVRPTAYDPDRGLLTLQPDTASRGAHLRMSQQLLMRHLNNALGKPAVRTIRVLPPGGRRDGAPDPAPQQAAPKPEAPVKTRETAHPGYRHTLALALDNRLTLPPETSYEEEARRRQEAALRANRLPESEDREAYWAQQDAVESAGPEPGSMAASEAAARAYARSQAAGRTPRRAFDVA